MKYDMLMAGWRTERTDESLDRHLREESIDYIGERNMS